MAKSNKINADLQESERLEALAAYHVLDTEPEQAFDYVTEIAAEVCDTPIALVSLVDETRQWFKSRVGLDTPETPRNIAFCNEAIKGVSLLEIPDANKDPRFTNNPLVTGPLSIRYYAGAPLITPGGYNIGTLCVIDHKPRKLTKMQKAALSALAHGVVVQFELRRALSESEQSRKKLKQEVKQRKASQTEQQRAEQFMRQSLDAMLDHIAIVDSEGEIVFVNRAWREFAKANALISSAPSFELGSNYLHVCHRASSRGNEEAEAIAASIKAILHEPELPGTLIEYPCHSPEEQRWFVASISSLVVNQQNYAVISHKNITRQKLAELEIIKLIDTLEERVKLRTEELSNAYGDLGKSEEKYRSLFENSSVGITISNPEGVFSDVNLAFCAMLGRTRHDLAGKKIDTVLHPGEQSDIKKLRAEIFSGSSLGFIKDLRMQRSDGKYVWFRASVAAIRDEFGKPVQTMTMVQDFSEQRKAQKERDRIFDTSMDMFAIVDYAGTIQQANPACTRVLGYTEAELIGTNVIDFVHPIDQENSRAVLEKMSNPGEDIPGLEIRMRLKNGEYRDIKWHGARQEEQDNLVVIGRDVTKSRNSERALHRLASRLQEIREDERTRISREIHDELGQMLTALKIDLDLLGRDIKSLGQPNLGKSLKPILELVDSTLGSVKRIAQDLRPEILDALGLIPALEWQANELQARTGLRCDFVCRHDIPPLDANQTTQLFRIIQEALTNVVRHAEATHVRIVIDLKGPDTLKISIHDNGKGFSVMGVESQSLGLLGMQERAHSIGAVLDIKSDFGSGTLVTILLPPESSLSGEHP